MRNNRYLAMLLILVLLLLPASAIADFGDFGGSSDFGGSDSWSSSDSSWDSSGSSYYDGGSGGSFNMGVGGWVIILAALLFYYLVIKRGMHKQSTQQDQQRPAGAAPTTGLRPLQAIYEWDPQFSAADMQQRLSKLYVQMQNAWQAKDLSPLRGDFTDQQYAQYDRQLQRYRDEGLTNVIERITVLGVDLKGVKQDDTHDILVATMRTRITDYVVNDKTGAVVRGSKTAEKFMEYEWTMVRPKGKTTIRQDADEAFNCPNCGAPININQSAQCPYCGTIVTKAEYDWVIAGIKGLSQRTVG